MVLNKGGEKMKFISFGNVCLNFRAKHNLTQNQLTEILGISHNMVGRYEAEINKPTKARRIRFENKMKEWEENKNVSLQ
jgi:transcriptional regulator with XRE-family HTH domain